MKQIAVGGPKKRTPSSQGRLVRSPQVGKPKSTHKTGGSVGVPSEREGNGRSLENPKQNALVIVGKKFPKQKEIHFYRANEKPYGAFSNLYRRSIIFEGQVFLTAEHAYQAGKPSKEAVRQWILSAPSPALLAMAAHGLYSWDIVPNWAKIKYDRMREVLAAKFAQHDDLKRLLLETGDARLVEAGRVSNVVNKTWGEVNGKGLNMLGRFLMELRDKLNKEVANSQISPRSNKKRGSSRPKVASSR
jgi:ribA/ribD-fused uncharacterized protein